MKKLLIILFSVGLALGATAQGHGGGGYHYVRPRVVIGIGAYAPFYPFGYSPFYPYPYYGYGYGYSHRPTKLDLQIEDIKNDYKDRIWSVKHDDNLPRKERKQKVHELKHERDDAITQAKKDYYKTR